MDIQTRRALFLVGCMGTRAALAYAAYAYPEKALPWMAWPALVIAVGFAVIYVGRLRPRGRETGGGPIWWDGLRPVHAALWFAFALMALRRDSRAWRLLAADTALGLAAFVGFHYAGASRGLMRGA